jgi:hypothetical protein
MGGVVEDFFAQPGCTMELENNIAKEIESLSKIGPVLGEHSPNMDPTGLR